MLTASSDLSGVCLFFFSFISFNSGFKSEKLQIPEQNKIIFNDSTSKKRKTSVAPDCAAFPVPPVDEPKSAGRILTLGQPRVKRPPASAHTHPGEKYCRGLVLDKGTVITSL